MPLTDRQKDLLSGALIMGVVAAGAVAIWVLQAAGCILENQSAERVAFCDGSGQYWPLIGLGLMLVAGLVAALPEPAEDRAWPLRLYLAGLLVGVAGPVLSLVAG